MTLDQFFESPPVWIFPAFFVFVWWFVLTLIARVSGWSELAEYYGDKDRLDGPRRRFQSMAMGRGGLNMANFGGVITLTATPYALEIATFFPFSLSMKPLAFPLSDLASEAVKTFFVVPAVEVRAARAPSVRMRLSTAQAQWIEEKTGAPLAGALSPT